MKYVISFAAFILIAIAASGQGHDSTGNSNFNHYQAINGVVATPNQLIIPLDTLQSAYWSPMGSIAFVGGYFWYNTGMAWVTNAGGGGGVVSVNGLTGVVSITTTNIPEGTNLYFTNARVYADSTVYLAYVKYLISYNSTLAADTFATQAARYLTANQPITVSMTGPVTGSGSGTTAISITSAIGIGAINGGNIALGAITNANISSSAAIAYSKLNVNDAIQLSDLAATGSPSSSTWLRGDYSWATLPAQTLTVNATPMSTGNAYTITATPSGSAGGDLTGTYPNPILATVNATPSTYGDATTVPQITVDAKGRATSVTNVHIAYLWSSLTGIPATTLTGDITSTVTPGTSGTATLKNTGTAGTYGDASHIPSVTTDAQGRVTGVSTYTFTSGGGTVTSIGVTTPSILYTVSPSTITTSGTFAFTLVNQNPHTFLSGYLTGTTTPTFRAIDTSDIPSNINGFHLISSIQLLGSPTIQNTPSSGDSSLKIANTGWVNAYYILKAADTSISAAYTLTSRDFNRKIHCKNTSNIALTIPTGLTNSPISFQCLVIQDTIGTVTFTASSTTLYFHPSGTTKSNGQMSQVNITSSATANVFSVQGDLQ